MRVVITGANGFVGSSLVDKFTDNGYEVLAIDVSFSATRFRNNNLVTIIESDLSDISDLEEKIGNNCDLFYNLAWRGVNGPEKAKYDIQLDNIKLSLRCCELAKRLGCKKYLCAGTIAERSVESLPLLNSTNPGLMYAVAKYCNHIILENYCKTINLSFVWMQFSNIYGPSNKTGNLISYTLLQLRQGLEADFGPANQPYDFVFVDDLIEAVFRLGVYSVSKNFYFIGSGEPKLLSEYLELIGSVFGRPDLIKIGKREDDGIKYSFEMFDISGLVQEIGSYVETSFEENIKATIEAF